MARWCYFETGNETRRDAALRYLRRTKVHHEMVDRSDEVGYYWYRVRVRIDSQAQHDDINNWLNTQYWRN